jgi:hypothetical protein
LFGVSDKTQDAVFEHSFRVDSMRFYEANNSVHYFVFGNYAVADFLSTLILLHAILSDVCPKLKLNLIVLESLHCVGGFSKVAKVKYCWV